MLKIYFSKHAKKSLRKFAKSDIKLSKRIIKKTAELQENPKPVNSTDLVNFPLFKRVKVGKYRIIYRYDTKIIYIYFIEKREDAYKNLKLLLLNQNFSVS